MRKPVIDQNLTKKIKIDQIANVASRLKMALLIEQALGLDAAPLLTLQMEYNLQSAKRNKSFLERLKDIPRIAAEF
jgi:plasmid maintenance system antidote protein VapI